MSQIKYDAGAKFVQTATLTTHWWASLNDALQFGLTMAVVLIVAWIVLK